MKKFELVVGSNAYNLQTPKSDKDVLLLVEKRPLSRTEPPLDSSSCFFRPFYNDHYVLYDQERLIKALLQKNNWPFGWQILSAVEFADENDRAFINSIREQLVQCKIYTFYKNWLSSAQKQQHRIDWFRVMPKEYMYALSYLYTLQNYEQTNNFFVANRFEGQQKEVLMDVRCKKISFEQYEKIFSQEIQKVEKLKHFYFSRQDDNDQAIAIENQIIEYINN